MSISCPLLFKDAVLFLHQKRALTLPKVISRPRGKNWFLPIQRTAAPLIFIPKFGEISWFHDNFNHSQSHSQTSLSQVYTSKKRKAAQMLILKRNKCARNFKVNLQQSIIFFISKNKSPTKDPYNMFYLLCTNFTKFVNIHL